jgi:phenylpyruvate tautomerase PptA (4-oxalocrotonate tautomerase family)
MPLYQVEHSSPLTRAEKNDIAASITRIHQSAFGAPSIFIGITFKDISDVEYYTGPNLVSMNICHCHYIPFTILAPHWAYVVLL